RRGARTRGGRDWRAIRRVGGENPRQGARRRANPPKLGVYHERGEVPTAREPGATLRRDRILPALSHDANCRGPSEGPGDARVHRVEGSPGDRRRVEGRPREDARFWRHPRPSDVPSRGNSVQPAARTHSEKRSSEGREARGGETHSDPKRSATQGTADTTDRVQRGGRGGTWRPNPAPTPDRRGHLVSSERDRGARREPGGNCGPRGARGDRPPSAAPPTASQRPLLIRLASGRGELRQDRRVLPRGADRRAPRTGARVRRGALGAARRGDAPPALEERQRGRGPRLRGDPFSATLAEEVTYFLERPRVKDIVGGEPGAPRGADSEAHPYEVATRMAVRVDGDRAARVLRGPRLGRVEVHPSRVRIDLDCSPGFRARLEHVVEVELNRSAPADLSGCRMAQDTHVRVLGGRTIRAVCVSSGNVNREWTDAITKSSSF